MKPGFFGHVHVEKHDTTDGYVVAVQKVIVASEYAKTKDDIPAAEKRCRERLAEATRHIEDDNKP